MGAGCPASITSQTHPLGLEAVDQTKTDPVVVLIVGQRAVFYLLIDKLLELLPELMTLHGKGVFTAQDFRRNSMSLDHRVSDCLSYLNHAEVRPIAVCSVQLCATSTFVTFAASSKLGPKPTTNKRLPCCGSSPLTGHSLRAQSHQSNE